MREGYACGVYVSNRTDRNFALTQLEAQHALLNKAYEVSLMETREVKAVVQGLFGLLLVLIFAVVISQSAHALIFRLDVTASSFPAGAPQDPVSATFYWEANSLSDPIDSLVSVDLTIAGYTYQLSELGYLNDPTGFEGRSLIGGLLNGVDTSKIFTDDFFFMWDRTLSAPRQFIYNTLETDSAWAVFVVGGGGEGQFTNFRIMAVPEPPELAIMIAALAGIAATGRVRSWRGKTRGNAGHGVREH